MEDLGVTVVTKTLVTDIEGDIVTVKQGDEINKFGANTVLWAAGVKASPLGKTIAEKTGTECDQSRKSNR